MEETSVLVNVSVTVSLESWNADMHHEAFEHFTLTLELPAPLADSAYDLMVLDIPEDIRQRVSERLTTSSAGDRVYVHDVDGTQLAQFVVGEDEQVRPSRASGPIFTVGSEQVNMQVTRVTPA